ncbi:maleylpyruvate isomerase family mycothiol-dependent enzyme [Actinomycetospora sp. TBRC 11914]|uniref:maleylpyruvate isomerase family mycothiol-dependent enzyme n=1 Tax=Actinomycetospora sp. TBRC 11914 TaxID=2729387 RepID=UPI00145D7370|nr:maleylpyruvate isomerase family mycothiol-dependent enzyme [Actinomycetospora sp. TBRC 11914]NMO88857.1 maleylpyruvate isomerase family mycothiol-dependent enzyme [Actinomycetospora sp. TBRC 11914]
MAARVGMLDDVAAERLGLADELAALTTEQWRTPSLCAGWTVHDVVAHLTLSTRQSVPWTLWRVARARGDLERAFADMARERASAYPPAELLDQLRAMARVDRRLAVSGELDPLNDLLVHSQDVLVPLGRGRDLPVARALPCLRHTWAAPFVGAARRFAGLRLRATDADWAEGDGPEVCGPAGALLLAANGRAAGLEGCDGEGLGEAHRRFG